MSSVAQVVADPDFGKLSAEDQQGVLTHFDPDFSKVNAGELPAVIQGIQKNAMTRPDLANPPGVPKPRLEMQPSNLGTALSPTQSVASPGEASYVAEADPESQSRMRTAASIGAGGAASVAASPAALAKLLPPTIAGVQAVGEWARRNPVLAYAIYHQLNQHFGGAVRFIRGMPNAEPGTE